MAKLLHGQGADMWRVRAYQQAATTLRGMRRDAVEVLDREGTDGLIAIPTIGKTIAGAIEEMAWRGRWAQLDRLRGEVTPEETLMTLPGMGETLAGRLHDELGIDTLEDLELAAHDGRLAQVEGFGPRRVPAIRDMLATQLSRSPRRKVRRVSEAPPPPPTAADDLPIVPMMVPTEPDVDAPDIALLLELDAAYRTRAAAGDLPTIAPRRFNPTGERWLPIWHVNRDDWDLTLLFSNSAQAHQLGKTDDWVVVYWEHAGHEDQATVVTEYRGPLMGRRVVRGRERECLSYWAKQTEKRAEEARWRRIA